jgi:SsrA-binding protein
VVVQKSAPAVPVIADNRRARFDYELLDTLEVGIQLTGTEVKSLRANKANIAESYVQVKNGELWLINANIPEYTLGNRFNHEPRRTRKLLAHGREIARLFQGTSRDGLTVVPLKIYFNERGRVKLEIALAKGKKKHDKRETSKERDWQRDKARLLRERG